MADNPIDALNAAREKLVAERRAQVKNMVDMDAGSFINEFLRRQTAIEGIDRALDDEMRLAGTSDEGQ